MRHVYRRMSCEIQSIDFAGIPRPNFDYEDDEVPDIHPSPNLISSNSTPAFAVSSGLILPTLNIVSPIPRISPLILSYALEGKYDDYFDNLYIIDCRFEYEFNGGHIRNAFNLSSPDQLKEKFIDNPEPRAVFVFHCEFSHNRGPSIAQIFREMDRFANKSRHPAIYYPNVYILEGGYREFYNNFQDQCEGGYRPMIDPGYQSLCQRSMQCFRQNVQKAMKEMRKPLSRETNSQHMFTSPINFQERYSNSPTTTRYRAKLVGALKFD
ncbi:Rhodanese-like domain containing protein [Trichomonas vaginalis G3]|uniref:protein-tyrosine-phosphatase n=1 Tax=Trichomonas vaginalis (strain ATCC PRA-98 / G3) TaxID=412133 RepID=A2DRY7_TRIV3|nr:positive regulation of cell cycle G2/M phase transition [Trichomonas vaginalis G3]EAY16757.1 Rhodanese-like domain containing protein [Trichomonas vaginalis G3]KAI5490836.1 positive regulation of cell cycle G2/M phase transition [Trichomonas vaginalis G3]|eukprot:XP_001328980.1 Rhodanese-like domain containing protein [Trichomonas vaginalis G3]